MADLYVKYERTPYFDRHSGMTHQEYHAAIERSTTVYVGNLSYYTTENQIIDFFARCGEVKRVVMGLDKFQKTPCGFCFVEYYSQEDTEASVRYLNNLRLDDRQIRLDRDPGFVEGRQYGRGKSGGQVRDEYRTDFDLGRGGFGRVIQEAGYNDMGAANLASQWGGGGYLGGPREPRSAGREARRDGGRDGGREAPLPTTGKRKGREENDSDDEGQRRRGRRRDRGEGKSDSE